MAGIILPPEIQRDSTKIEDTIRNQTSVTRQEISFSGLSKSCCIGIVDAVNSTKVTLFLERDKMCEYYRIFLNCMAAIAKEFDAVIVKNVGDSLLYYFPRTEDGVDKSSFRKVLDCGLAMIESHYLINKLMHEHGLPPVHYRISSDYGKLDIAKSSHSDAEDLFGPTVNVCAKMNTIALPNQIVIGGDLYQLVRSFKEYNFKTIAGYSLGLKLDYSIYTLFKTKIWFS